MQRLLVDADLYQGIMAAAFRQDDETALRRLRQLAQQLHEATAALRSFAQTVLVFAQNHETIRLDFAYAQRLGLDAGMRTQPSWSEIEIQWDVAGQSLRSAIRHLTGLAQHLHEQQWWVQEPFAALLQDLQGAAEYLTTLASWLDRIVFEAPGTSGSDVVTWMEVNDGVTEVSLVAAPLFVNETLESQLVHRKRCAIFTGATLRTGSGFSFIRDRLGLWDVTASTVDSPFDYRQSTLLYLPSDMPEPNHNNFQQAVEQAIIKASVASAGATLALFTSYAQLRATAEAIRAPLDRLGITVLQHGTSSRQRLLREYREADKAVLLGTRSFWEGIDLPGDELRCLLIVRLPFAVPSDPLVAARTAELDNAFRDYTLPDAILRFRQGFGRLIRRATDRGVVVVLDSRVWRKEYGNAFLESLPECTTRHAPLSNLEAEISRWLNRHAATERVRD
jgi:DNA polymerase-3 subunit epsilon/ATP-dependent DNA helicase DinG